LEFAQGIVLGIALCRSLVIACRPPLVFLNLTIGTL
jgi:hypothetical protein